MNDMYCVIYGIYIIYKAFESEILLYDEQAVKSSLEEFYALFNFNCKTYNIELESIEYYEYIIKTNFIFYCAYYETAKDYNNTLKHPSEMIKDIAYHDYLEKVPVFRGKVISLKTTIIDNKERSIILYDNKEYKFDEFLVAMYPELRKSKSVVFMPYIINDLLKIGPSQRIKLKYNILSKYIGLPSIDEEELKVLRLFLNIYKNNTAMQKYYFRSNWKDGLEKMIAFGADLDVSGKVDGPIEKFWCYRYVYDNNKIIFDGYSKSIEDWIDTIKDNIYIEYDSNYEGIYIFKKILPKCINKTIKSLYYQNGCIFSIPEIQIGRQVKGKILDFYNILERRVEKALNGKKFENFEDFKKFFLDNRDRCFDTLQLPDCKSEPYFFTIDLEKDVKIVEKQSAARIQQAIDGAFTTAAERLIGLKAGDKITTKELRERGYKNNDGRAINTLVEYGILERGPLRGKYTLLMDF